MYPISPLVTSCKTQPNIDFDTIYWSYSGLSCFTRDNVDLEALGPTHENETHLLGLIPDLTTSTKLIIKQSCQYIDSWWWKCFGKRQLGEGTSHISAQSRSEIPPWVGMINVLHKQLSARMPRASKLYTLSKTLWNQCVLFHIQSITWEGKQGSIIFSFLSEVTSCLVWPKARCKHWSKNNYPQLWVVLNYCNQRAQQEQSGQMLSYIV